MPSVVTILSTVALYPTATHAMPLPSLGVVAVISHHSARHSSAASLQTQVTAFAIFRFCSEGIMVMSDCLKSWYSASNMLQNSRLRLAIGQEVNYTARSRVHVGWEVIVAQKREHHQPYDSSDKLQQCSPYQMQLSEVWMLSLLSGYSLTAVWYGPGIRGSQRVGIRCSVLQ